MYFEQVTTPGLGCFSYAVGCPVAGVMCVVDPRRDTKIYLRMAEEYGMRITHIFDTHVHADHVSGAQQLRAETGATINIHESAPVKYEAQKVKHGDEFKFGNALVRILYTPGHTPNSISLLVSDLARSPLPQMILTGDLLFVGDIGRPDLPGAEILEEQTENLYNSLHKTLGQLPDYLEVYPGHGQGSLCGGGMSAKPFTTLGYERLANPMLQISDYEEFRRIILSNFPMRPQSFSGIIPGNMEKVAIIPQCEDLTAFALSPDEMDELRKAGVTLLDLRDGLSFSAAHIPGSIHVDASFSGMLNWVGMAIPPDTPLALILPSNKSFEEMRLELQRIGYDNVKGWLKGGLVDWIDEGREIRRLPHVSASALRTCLAGANPPVLVDVRTPKEFNRTHIEGAIHLPFDRIIAEDTCLGILENREAIIICAGGFRASVAASMLLARGCANLSVLSGGMGAWEYSKDSV